MTETSNRYAIVNIFGRQHKVSEGAKIKVNYTTAEVGSECTFSEVLLMKDGEDVKVGAPILENAKVTASVAAHGRDPKILVFKYLRKNKLKKTKGHRQDYSVLHVKSIQC